MSGTRPESRRAEPPPARRRRFSLWRLVRHDIGRKGMALALALMLWLTLFEMVSGERWIELDVRPVASRQQADIQSIAAPAVYLVVPNELIVRDELSRLDVTVYIRGSKREIENLNFSAIIEIDPREIGGEDEEVVHFPLDRSSFRTEGGDPDLTEFRVNPPSLKIVLARRMEAEFDLTPLNVTPTGVPREGFTYELDNIRVRPNRVRMSGPRSAIEDIQNDPTRLKLEPVDVKGRTLDVSQEVGLDREKVDRGVTLETAGGVVDVTIPIEPRGEERELLALPVQFANEEHLERTRRAIVSVSETVDVKIKGPSAKIGHLSNEELVRNIRLFYDWEDAMLLDARARLVVFTSGELPEGIEITGLDGRAPEIEYKLEELDIAVSTATTETGDVP